MKREKKDKERKQDKKRKRKRNSKRKEKIRRKRKTHYTNRISLHGITLRQKDVPGSTAHREWMRIEKKQKVSHRPHCLGHM